MFFVIAVRKDIFIRCSPRATFVNKNWSVTYKRLRKSSQFYNNLTLRNILTIVLSAFKNTKTIFFQKFDFKLKNEDTE